MKRADDGQIEASISGPLFNPTLDQASESLRHTKRINYIQGRRALRGCQIPYEDPAYDTLYLDAAIQTPIAVLEEALDIGDVNTKVPWQPLHLHHNVHTSYLRYQETVRALTVINATIEHNTNNVENPRPWHRLLDVWIWRALFMDDYQKYSDCELNCLSASTIFFDNSLPIFELNELPDISRILLQHNNWWRKPVHSSTSSAFSTPGYSVTDGLTTQTSFIQTVVHVMQKTLPEACQMRDFATILTKNWQLLDFAAEQDVSQEAAEHPQVAYVARRVFFFVRRILVAALLGIFPRSRTQAKFNLRYHVHRDFLWNKGCSSTQLRIFIGQNEEFTLLAMREFLFYSVDQLPAFAAKLKDRYPWESNAEQCSAALDHWREHYEQHSVDGLWKGLVGVSSPIIVAGDPTPHTHINGYLTKANKHMKERGARHIDHTLLEAMIRAFGRVDCASGDIQAIFDTTHKIVERHKNIRQTLINLIELDEMDPRIDKWDRHYISPSFLQLYNLSEHAARHLVEAQKQYRWEMNGSGIETALKKIHTMYFEDYCLLRYFYWIYRQRSCFRLYDLPGDVTTHQLDSYRRLHKLSPTDELPLSTGIYHICLNCGRINAIVMSENLIPSKKLQGECQTHDCNSCSVDVSLKQIEMMKDPKHHKSMIESLDVYCCQRSDRRRQMIALPSAFNAASIASAPAS